VRVCKFVKHHAVDKKGIPSSLISYVPYPKLGVRLPLTAVIDLVAETSAERSVVTGNDAVSSTITNVDPLSVGLEF